MGIFDTLQAAQNAPKSNGNIFDAMNRLKENPSKILNERGLSVPPGMNNPQQIVQHLVQSGQVPQSRFLQAMQMFKR